MTMYLFGSGTVIAKQVGVTLPVPAFLGTIQDFEFTIDQTIKELMGQYKSPVAIAAAQQKITMKAKFARISSPVLNNYLLGQTLVPSSGFDMAVAEQWNVPTETTAAGVITVSQATSFGEDLGVFYGGTGTNAGAQFTSQTSATAVQQYQVDTAGHYTFFTGDHSQPVQIFYSYFVATMSQINWGNDFMGNQPVFEVYARQSFKYLGQVKEMLIKLNACVSGKINFPFKNTDFMIQEMDIQAFADAGNNIGTIAMTE